MRQIERVVAATLAGVVVSSAAAQDAVRWRVEDGGNGHWYEWVPWGEVSSFNSVSDISISRGGHLATLNSPEEEVFVRLLIQEGGCGTPPQKEVVIGLVQPPNAKEPAGGWQWNTGEVLRYTNWRQGEPNNASGIEDVGVLNAESGWNDQRETISGCGISAIVEWSADCNGDGIVDYGQILDGTYPDEDGNGVPDCCDADEVCDPCIGDLNRDGVVGPPDLGILLAVWGTDGGGIVAADINGDGTVNASDLGLLLGAWGVCP
ncbi:hypothetical protein OAG01_00660 [bacterium]|nr:hypothetical protein [bacterium]MDB4632935.1 hypothetical protein [bacterium]